MIVVVFIKHYYAINNTSYIYIIVFSIGKQCVFVTVILMTCY